MLSVRRAAVFMADLLASVRPYLSCMASPPPLTCDSNGLSSVLRLSGDLSADVPADVSEGCGRPHSVCIITEAKFHRAAEFKHEK